jgi:hypothetical protein
MHIWCMLFDRVMGRRTAREKDFERELHPDLELEAEEQQVKGVSAIPCAPCVMSDTAPLTLGDKR